MLRVVLIAMPLIAACGTVPPPESEIPVRGETPGHICRNEGLGGFVGQAASSEVGAEMLQASGARIIRWVQPGMMVTMDYREDRLTVRLESGNRIASASCG